MKTKLAIYGAGGMGREMAAMVKQLNNQMATWELIGFFDDGIPKDSARDGLEIIGGITDLNAYGDPLSVCIAVAEPNARLNIINKLINPNIDYPVIAHPNSIIGDVQRNKVGRGSIITAGVILTTGIEIGEFTIVNLSSTIGHDVKIGRCCTVMPGCNISGNVSIGDCTMLGTGSKIIQGKTIGSYCLVGAGAVVTKDFGDNLRIIGVPARGLKSI